MIFAIAAIVGVVLIALVVWVLIKRRQERIAAGLPVGRERLKRK